ncbi:hypothetical protein GCM10020258_07290 [Sphingomonas yabuuchiae]
MLLGIEDGVPHFARLTGEPAVGRSFEMIAALHALEAGEAATYAAARSVLDWHARHGFCAKCGAATAPFRAGWGRHCPVCGTEHFPRVDPVVIMIAEHDGRALLGRQPAFPPGRYSALAGFLEPGDRSRKRWRASCSRKRACGFDTSAISPASPGRSRRR